MDERGRGGEGEERGEEGGRGWREMEEMEKEGGALNYTCAIYTSHKGQITNKVPHTKHTAHRSLTLCIHCHRPRISTGGRHMPMYGCNNLPLIRAI